MNWGWKRVNEIVRFIGHSADPHAIKIGNEAENLAQAIKFELPHEFKYATAFLHIQFGYYADVVNLGDDRIFKPTRTHTQKPGRYTAYLEVLIDGDVVWKSDVFFLHVGSLPQDGEIIEQQYPTAIEDALRAVETLTGVGARAVTLDPGSDATVALEEDADGNRVIVFGIPRGHDGSGGGGSDPGTAGADGGYYTPSVSASGDLSWKPSKSSMPAAPTVNIKGADGYSPTISVSTIAGGHRLTITDAKGSRTVDVKDGASGITPVKGTDYYTAADKAEMVTMVLAALPTWTGGSY